MSRTIKNKRNRPIHFEEYVHANGIDHYLYHCGTDEQNPVLLFLHGGPGNPESLFCDMFQTKWEELYTVVHWDQRGTGKTLTKNPNAYPTIELMLQDLYEIVQYLKEKYKQNKIVLLGHSWGTVLGSIYVRQHPEDVLYYIGTGQVISLLENERVGYQKLLECIEQADDRPARAMLARIGEYPGERVDFTPAFHKKITAIRKLQEKYNLAIKIGPSMWRAGLGSPIFRFADVVSFLKGGKANDQARNFLGTFDLNTEPAQYCVPIYYILGDQDWQTPYPLAQAYFSKIEAPRKQLFMIPKAGHMTMMDQAEFYADVLLEIWRKESDVRR